MRKLCVGLAVPLVLAPSPALTAVLCVRPTGGACHATINAALAVAGPGDTIRVSRGVYKENITLSYEGLRLIGAGRLATIIDTPIPMLTGAPVELGANRVEVAAIGIRAGGGDAVFVRGISGATVRQVRIFGGYSGAGVRGDVGATTLSVIGSEIVGGGVGVSLNGINHGAVIRGNTIRQVQTGVEVLADDVEVSGNRISSFRTYGIRVEGVRAEVRDNVIENGFESAAALSVIGDTPQVLRNHVSNAGPLVVRCLASCATARVALNAVVGTATASRFDTQVGLRATGDVEGLVLQGNRVTRAVGPAFLVEGTGVSLTGNVALDTGQPDGGEGFLVRGPGGRHQLQRNTARRVGASGFRVETNDVTLSGNLSQGAGLYGFFVFGARGANSGNVLERNRALDSNGAGFALAYGPIATVLRSNAGSGNRYDLCDDGSGTVLAGANAFATTSSVCDVLR